MKTVPLSAPSQFPAYEARPGDHGVQFAHSHVSRAPAEATVGVDVDFVRGGVAQYCAQALRNIFGGLGVERFDIDDAGSQFAAVMPFLPLLDLGHFPASELEHELVCACF